jgi:amino acid adenylation domain-containing protein
MIPRELLQDLYPLSPMQEGMLFHHLAHPDSSAYLEQISFSLNGSLNPALFEQAWNLQFQRHAIFRTAFVYEKTSRPLQVVLKSRKVNFTLLDFSSLVEINQQNEISEFLKRDKAQVFDLMRDVLVRVTVIQLAPRSFHIVWTHHHILLDGWCVTRIERECLSVYQNLVSGITVDLPLPPGYGRYIQWLQGRDEKESLQYWTKYLAGYGQVPQLPRRSHRDPRYVLQKVVLELDPDRTRRLVELAGQWQVTLNTLTQSIWSILVSQFSRTSDVVFGTIVSGRPPEIPGVEEMMGLFINVVPVRARMNGQFVSELAQSMQRESVDGAAFHYTPLGELSQATGFQGPLFDHLFVYENYPISQGSDGADDEFSIGRVERFEQTNYDFLLVVEPLASLTVQFHFNESVFDSAQIQIIADHFEFLVSTILDNPGSTIDELSPLSFKEKFTLQEIHGAAPSVNSRFCVHEVFRTVAAASPEKLAAVFGSESITYSELNRRSDALATELLQRSVSRGAMVAVYLEPSVSMLVSWLAILKAGAAYLPLDPGYPDDRLHLILADSHAAILVSEEDLSSRFAVRNFSFKSWKPSDVSAPADINSDPQDTAYVIYTSGSTGKPKGVVVPHCAIFRVVLGAHYCELLNSDRIAQASNVAFDAATFEIWGALLNGATLVGIPKQAVIDPISFAAVLESERISILFITTAIFNQVAAHAPKGFRHLRCLLFGGEMVDASSVSMVQKLGNPLRLLHVYGPTETTTFASSFVIEISQSAALNVPIGRAIDNTALYVLNERQQEMTRGMIGELFVGGDGLATCYLNHPSLTADRFLPSPFGIGERLYKTGDLVRALPGGDIEFLGRTDHQVKIRGFRIEPGEIEVVLGRFANLAALIVEPCIVNGEKVLVAYFVMKSGHESRLLDLRQFAQSALPRFMVPSFFVRLESLPLNPNGKIDRAALPGPTDQSIEEDCTKPSNPTEMAVHKIWMEVLGLPGCGIHRNFFEMGGHSLKATQVMSRLRKLFNVDIPIQSIFDKPTIAQFSGWIDEAIRTQPVLAAEPALTRRARSAVVLPKSEPDQIGSSR